MRRGIGLADIMLYLFVLILVSLTVIIAGLPGLFSSVSVTIDSSAALDQSRTVATQRSVSEGLMIHRSSQGLVDETISGYEVVSSYASYVYTDPSLRRYRDAFILQEPRSHSMLTIRRSVHDEVLPVAPERRSFDSYTALSFLHDGTDSFTAGSNERSRDRNMLLWVPGHIGPHPQVRSVGVTYTAPLEVWFDEG